MANSKISALTSATTPLAGTETLPVVQSSTTKQVSVANLTAGRTVSMNKLVATTNTATGNASATETSSYLISDWDATNDFIGKFSADYFGKIKIGWSLAATGSDPASATYTNILTLSRGTQDVQLDSGNLVIATSGKGIDFSATPGTGTSELLADYEEGTWTPTVSGTGTAGTYQIGTNGCTYTKIGRTVTLQGYIQFAAVVTGGGTGSLQITGLPFSKTANSYPAGSVYLALGTYTGISPIVVFGSFSASSTLLLQQNATGGYGTAVGIGFASANAYLAFTLSYEV
jgi:hypothetical protein